MAILALDQGTTSSRAVLFDNDGRIISQFSQSINQFYPRPGWVEHDPYEILNSIILCAKKCVIGYNGSIDAVGITNQRETVIAWNAETGEPLGRAIVWQCRRTADYCEELIKDGFNNYIKQSTGLNVDAYFSATKIKWILDNVPNAQALADNNKLLFGTVDSWIIWNLTGNHYTDVTNASRTMLLNIKTLEWDSIICKKLSIPLSTLPKVVDNCFDFGRIKCSDSLPECLWDLKICSSVGDQQGAMFGQQCINIGDVKNTYGTGCFALMNIGSDPKIADSLLTTVAWKIGEKTVYAIEGSVFNAGSSIQWLRDELHLISAAKECDVLAEKTETSDGVMFVSAFTGLGAPYWDMYARGTFLGLSRGTGREQICRAVLEGIAFQVADLIHTMEKEINCQISVLKVDGGASVSDVMMQFQSDILRCTVDRPECVESTALGAAYMAGITAGIWGEADLISKRVSQKIFVPAISAERSSLLIRRWHKAVSAVTYFSESVRDEV